MQYGCHSGVFNTQGYALDGLRRRGLIDGEQAAAARWYLALGPCEGCLRARAERAILRHGPEALRLFRLIVEGDWVPAWALAARPLDAKAFAEFAALSAALTGLKTVYRNTIVLPEEPWSATRAVA